MYSTSQDIHIENEKLFYSNLSYTKQHQKYTSTYIAKKVKTG